MGIGGERMSKKEKEEVPEVWTQKWGVKIREPQEMPDTMAKFVVDVTDKAFEEHSDFDKDGPVIATDIRKALEEKYEPCWQVVLGRNFGSHVTYQSNHFINFQRGQVRVSLVSVQCSSDSVLVPGECARNEDCVSDQ